MQHKGQEATTNTATKQATYYAERAESPSIYINQLICIFTIYYTKKHGRLLILVPNYVLVTPQKNLGDTGEY